MSVDVFVRKRQVAGCEESGSTKEAAGFVRQEGKHISWNANLCVLGAPHKSARERCIGAALLCTRARCASHVRVRDMNRRSSGAPHKSASEICVGAALCTYARRTSQVRVRDMFRRSYMYARLAHLTCPRARGGVEADEDRLYINGAAVTRATCEQIRRERIQ